MTPLEIAEDHRRFLATNHLPLARSFGATYDDREEHRAAAVYLTRLPDVFYSAIRPHLGQGTIHLTELDVHHTDELLIVRRKRRFWPGYAGLESWSGRYEPESLLQRWHGQFHWDRDNDRHERLWDCHAHAVQFLVWDERFGVDDDLSDTLSDIPGIL